MKLHQLIFLVLIVLVSCKEEGLKVKFDLQDIQQECFIGNGVQWSAYPHADSDDAEWGPIMTDKKWQTVFDRLDKMNPSMVRVIDQANWRYLKGFDESGAAIVDYSSQEVKSLEKLLSYCQDRNITVLFGEWGCPFQVHDTDAGFSGVLTGATDERWINLIVDYLSYLIKDKSYTCIKYYNLVNEPNGSWASTNGNWDEWSEGVKILSRALDAAGLSEYVSIAGPDAVAHYDHPDSKYTGREWVKATVEQINEMIGIYDIHSYASLESVRTGAFTDFYAPLAMLADSVHKPIIFGELGFDKSTEANSIRIKKDTFASDDSQMSVFDFQYGVDMADAAVQLIDMGFGGALAWSLDDAMHTMDDQGDKYQLKRWGMWNILGTELCDNPDDENIRPWYYAWSLLCNYFPAGSQIVNVHIEGAEADDLHVRAAACVVDEDFSAAIVNNSDKIIDILVENPLHKELRKMLYSSAGFPEEGACPDLSEEVFSAAKKSIDLQLPARSLTLITSIK